jgi:hydroxyacylglutathione hydrolase
MKLTKSESGFEMVTFPVGALQCNCSIVWDPSSREAIVVDPGADADKIISWISKENLTLKAAIHTHAHFDHIGASTEVHQKLKAPLHLHPEDAALWENLDMQGKAFGFKLDKIPRWQTDLHDEDCLQFGSFQVKVLHTPGHTPGSCSFSCHEFLFSGDTLFRGSIGRTDLWGGDFSQISKSIKDRLYSLDEDTVVVCGHGPNTSIGSERRSNAFIKA